MENRATEQHSRRAASANILTHFCCAFSTCVGCHAPSAIHLYWGLSLSEDKVDSPSAWPILSHHCSDSVFPFFFQPAENFIPVRDCTWVCGLQ